MKSYLNINRNSLLIVGLFLLFSASFVMANTDVVKINPKSVVEPLKNSFLGNKFDALIKNESSKINLNNLNQDDSKNIKTDNFIKGQTEKNNLKKFIIGENLRVGMSLNEVFKVLGLPNSMKVVRGTMPKLDSIKMSYLDQGIIFHIITKQNKIEALELLSNFKGKFLEGVKIGSNETELIETFGIPHKIDSFVASYPQKGIYFTLNNKHIISMWVFLKNSELLYHRIHQNQ